MEKSAQFWVEHLKLNKHPEGGYYRETYRSGDVVRREALDGKFGGDRNVSTAIYYLLQSGDKSVFHRIKSDEIWHFYDGGSLSIYILDKSGVRVEKLGRKVDEGEKLQVVVPGGNWFASVVNGENNYVLAGCTVAPGFDFDDFEIAQREKLLQQYPSQAEIIRRLT